MPIVKEPYDPEAALDLLICSTCGTQFPSSDRSQIKTCYICDDPRQYVPATGQKFTTLREAQAQSKNEFVAYAHDENITFIRTSPQVGIGERAILIKTPKGNVLWDCIAFIDDDTIKTVKAMGGLHAIVISHPHFYTTHIQWARAFECPVYIAEEDRKWTTMTSSHQVPLTEPSTTLLDGSVNIIKVGGHFPGSLVLLHNKRLFVADTIMTTPAGVGEWHVDGVGNTRSKPPGLNSFSFMWSIPNMIPLSADEMKRMWDVIKKYEFTSTLGGFMGMDIEDAGVKGRVLESMKIQCKTMGYVNHVLMSDSI